MEGLHPVLPAATASSFCVGYLNLRSRGQLADLVASLVLKGIAIGERYAEKDAYDIYALCAHSRGGPQTVASALKPFMNQQLVQKGLRSIAQKFRALARIIHERFCCNRGFAAATRLSAGVLAAQSFNVLFQVRLVSWNCGT